MFGFKSKTEDKSEEAAQAARPGLFKRLREKLNRGNSWLTYDLANLLPAGRIDDTVLDELETRLITADVGVETTQRILEELRRKVERKELDDLEALLAALRSSLLDILRPTQQPLKIDGSTAPFAILVVGVNGAGKTTTIGKLARQLKQQGLKVMLAAGDTFRAAAVEQLQIWGDRNDVTVIAQATGADPAAVVFDALQAAARTAHRRSVGRHCRSPAHAVEPDGRTEEGEARDGPGRRARAARSAAGARCEPGTERAPAGARCSTMRSA